MIHLDDCIAIIRRVIELGVWNKVFSACADEHPTKKEFYTRSALAIGLAPPGFSEEVADYKIVSNALLKEALKYQFVQRLG
jgi:nucleoside-diphosphate-sugar epimerase